MGRKRKEKVKKRITLAVDEDLWSELEKDGVNRSRLFSLAAKYYLKRKKRLNDK